MDGRVIRPGGRAARRLLAALATIVGITLATFAALVAAPGDPFAALSEDSPHVDAAQAAELTRRVGADRPLPERYVAWCAALGRGDLGRSLRTGEPVTAVLAARLPATLELNAAAFAAAAGIGLPLGWWTATRRGRRTGRRADLVLLLLFAAPSFWIALVLQDLLAVRLAWLPLYGRTPGDGGSRLLHLVLPAAVLAAHELAFYARFARLTAAEGWHAPHARTARAAGVPALRVFVRHGLRPTFGALATLFGLLVPGFAAGTVLVESIFSWPGVGSLFVSAVQARDLPVVLGLTLLTAVLTVAGSLAADGLSALCDPRRRAGVATP